MLGLFLQCFDYRVLGICTLHTLVTSLIFTLTAVIWMLVINEISLCGIELWKCIATPPCGVWLKYPFLTEVNPEILNFVTKKTLISWNANIGWCTLIRSITSYILVLMSLNNRMSRLVAIVHCTYVACFPLLFVLWKFSRLFLFQYFTVWCGILGDWDLSLLWLLLAEDAPLLFARLLLSERFL